MGIGLDLWFNHGEDDVTLSMQGFLEERGFLDIEIDIILYLYEQYKQGTLKVDVNLYSLRYSRRASKKAYWKKQKKSGLYGNQMIFLYKKEIKKALRLFQMKGLANPVGNDYRRYTATGEMNILIDQLKDVESFSKL